MLQKILIPAAFAALLMLATSSQVHAYGAVHAGYTTVGAGGVQHYGTTTVAGPYGTATHTTSGSANAYGGERTTSTTASGAYGGQASATTTRAYSPTMYNGYSAAGVSGSAYGASVTRVGYYDH